MNHGLLVIDKPAGMTSRDAVDRAMRWFPKGTRIGHTGTLDPLATGVLVLCVGVATRLAEYVQAMKKTYRAGIFLGARSDTDDADGTITPVANASAPSQSSLVAALAELTGPQEQIPPAFSAAKVSGRRAYKLARQGKNPDLQPRSVHVYRMQLLDYRFPNVELEIECSKGTYIRSLARDLGEKLGCGGYVTSLRRTRIGPFTVEQAVSLHEPAVELRPLANAVQELPCCIVDAEAISRLRDGQALPLQEVATEKAPTAEADHAAFDISGNLLAVLKLENETWRPIKVIKP